MPIIRLLSALILAFGLGAIAQAAPVSLDPVIVGEDLTDKSDDYGARDIERLVDDLTESVSEHLERDGHQMVGASGDVRVALTLENAWPNRPTREQLRNELGLSYSSVSLGGASVSAVIYDANGEVIGEVSYRWRTRNISDSVGRGTWTDAHRAFDRFARQLSEQIPGGAS